MLCILLKDSQLSLCGSFLVPCIGLGAIPGLEGVDPHYNDLNWIFSTKFGHTVFLTARLHKNSFILFVRNCCKVTKTSWCRTEHHQFNSCLLSMQFLNTSFLLPIPNTAPSTPACHCFHRHTEPRPLQHILLSVIFGHQKTFTQDFQGCLPEWSVLQAPSEWLEEGNWPCNTYKFIQHCHFCWTFRYLLYQCIFQPCLYTTVIWGASKPTAQDTSWND